MKKHTKSYPKSEYILNPEANYHPVPFPEYREKYIFNVDDPCEVVNLNYYNTGRKQRCEISEDDSGHKMVCMTSPGKGQRVIRISHIVWSYHNGPVPKGYVVHHIDERPENNDISNLELKTASEHCADHNREKWKNGVFKGCGKAVICETDPEMRFETVTAAALELGVPPSSISLCCNGKLKTAGRMKWRFA